MVFTCVIGECDRTSRTLYKITASDIVQPVLPEPFYCCRSCVDRSIQQGLVSGFWIQKVPLKKRPQQSKHEHQEAPPLKIHRPKKPLPRPPQKTVVPEKKVPATKNGADAETVAEERDAGKENAQRSLASIFDIACTVGRCIRLAHSGQRRQWQVATEALIGEYIE